MAMDFFARQDHARRQTVRLIVLFALSLAVIIVAVYAVALLITQGGGHAHGRYAGAPINLWDPSLLLAVAISTIVVISLGSLYKVSELSSGGEVVANMMGGRLVDPQTTDPAERRLLNVVEEMSLASGVPVLPVYVLDKESSINAFAAGFRPTDAVVAVSRGCLQYLTREELQGVLGHEFSHVLNGDMRLNLRLIGIVYGILVLSIIGYFVMRSAGWASSSSSRSSDDRRGDNRVAIFFIGLALYILGYLGVLLGNIIKAAISRQREFLADASSVQFTRNPGGLASALKKIGGLADGSRIKDPHAHEISHMFFGDAFAGSIFNLFATHPPLEERIRLLDPNFDGSYAAVEALSDVGTAAQSGQDTAVAAIASGLAPGAASGSRGAVRPVSTDRDRIVGQVGSPQVEHLDYAGRMVAGLPGLIVQAVREPYAARGVVFALLLSREGETTRNQQWQLLQTRAEPPLIRIVQQLSNLVDQLPEENRLSVVDMTIPALKRLSPAQYQAFRQIVEALTAADGKIDLFEYCLRVILLGYLDVQFGLRPAPAVRYKAVSAVAQPAIIVLSALAYAGQSHPDDIQRAFQAGMHDLLGEVQIVPPQQCTFDSFDAALNQLAQASPAVKRRILQAVVACIAADGKMTVVENELLRAVSAALSCPLPPVPVN
ncbi:MAG: M48 family metallopeptidase [Thermoguttaceae bacterium]|jgi:Zn-dependent protease with chaperone function